MSRQKVVRTLTALVKQGKFSMADAGAYLRLHDQNFIDLSGLTEANADELLGKVSKKQLKETKKQLQRIAAGK